MIIYPPLSSSEAEEARGMLCAARSAMAVGGWESECAGTVLKTGEKRCFRVP